MALAKNLNPRKNKLKLPKFKKMNKWVVYGVIAISVVILSFGIVLIIPHIFPKSSEKVEVKYETGDRPLAQKTILWVTAEGGLFMRENPDSKSRAISLIPDRTQLTAEEIQGDWYKVIYQEKSGWINKGYTTTQAPAEDPTKNWQTYQNKTAGYSIRYPMEWVVQDYGSNPATGSDNYLGIGPQLPPTLDPSQLPPVVLRTTKNTLESIESNLSKQSSVVVEQTTISGISGKKFTYNASSGVQMTTFVILKGSTVFIFEETGGYSDELNKIIQTIILS